YSMVGMWEESIASNTSAMEIQPDYYHAADFTVYAHLQLAQDVKAKALIEKAIATPPRRSSERLRQLRCRAAGSAGGQGGPGGAWHEVYPTLVLLMSIASTSALSCLVAASHSSPPAAAPPCGQRFNRRGRDQVDVRSYLITQLARRIAPTRQVRFGG